MLDDCQLSDWTKSNLEWFIMWDKKDYYDKYYDHVGLWLEGGLNILMKF